MNPLFAQYFGSAHLEEYCSGVFSDSLDKLGLRQQVADGFRLNNPSLRLFGRIRTVLLETIETDDERISKGLGFLDSLSPHDVLLVKGSDDFAYFGELMSRLSMEKQLAGAIIDGLTRDSYYTQSISLPVFAKGYSARDIKGRGRVAAVDVPLTVAGITVTPGDHVFGDSDCLVFMPPVLSPELIAEIGRAVGDEAKIKAAIAAGDSVSDILKSFQAF